MDKICICWRWGTYPCTKFPCLDVLPVGLCCSRRNLSGEMGLRNCSDSIAHQARLLGTSYLGPYTVYGKGDRQPRVQCHSRGVVWHIFLEPCHVWVHCWYWRVVAPPSASMESSFWQMLGWKSSLFVPKGWINRLLSHNYLPTVLKLSANHAIVYFHQMGKKKSVETVLTDASNSYYNAQLWFLIAEIFIAKQFFRAPKSWYSVLCIKTLNIPAR